MFKMRFILKLIFKILYKHKDKKLKCKYCDFINYLFDDKIKSNRDYFIMTEIFVFLHGGKDYCNNSKGFIINE